MNSTVFVEVDQDAQELDSAALDVIWMRLEVGLEVDTFNVLEDQASLAFGVSDAEQAAQAGVGQLEQAARLTLEGRSFVRCGGGLSNAEVSTYQAIGDERDATIVCEGAKGLISEIEPLQGVHGCNRYDTPWCNRLQ